MKKNKAGTVILILSAVFTLAICGVMNLYLIPLIEETTNGIRMFDMQSFGYTFETAKEFTGLLSERGLDTFLHKQLPLDFLYPVVYGVFFSLALIRLAPGKKLFVLPPVLLALCDYAENICSIIMLKTDFSALVSRFGCAFTVTKTVMMYAVIALVFVLLIKRMIKRKKDV